MQTHTKVSCKRIGLLLQTAKFFVYPTVAKTGYSFRAHLSSVKKNHDGLLTVEVVDMDGSTKQYRQKKLGEKLFYEVLHEYMDTEPVVIHPLDIDCIE